MGCFLALGCAAGLCLRAQTDSGTADRPAVSDPASGPVNSRVFGVLPNNRTADGSQPFQRITVGQKMMIAVKDSFDWPIIPLSAAFAGLYQLENQNPSFGQGMAGYGKRLGTAWIDQSMGNLMTEGVVPSLARQDPRYFRLGQGTIRHRTLYALSRIFAARGDAAGKWSFNISEVGGNAIAAAFSNLYYPDTRNAKDNAGRLALQLGTDALGQLGKEFWPDIRAHFFHRRTG